MGFVAVQWPCARYVSSMFTGLLLTLLGVQTIDACLEPCTYEATSVNFQKVTESVKGANDFTSSALKTRKCCEGFQARLREAFLSTELAKQHLSEILKKHYDVNLPKPKDVNLAKGNALAAPVGGANAQAGTDPCDRVALADAMRKTYFSDLELMSMWRKYKNAVPGAQCDQLKEDIRVHIQRLVDDIDGLSAAITPCRALCKVAAGKAQDGDGLDQYFNSTQIAAQAFENL